jgi:ABC-2 type transport system ATP-binding protein
MLDRMAVIDVSNLRKSYGEQDAVRDVSFSVEPGEIFGILGPNGAGKTTTVECLAGLRHHDGGRIRVLGLDPERDRNQLRQVVGIQLQESQLPANIQVDEALELYSSFYRDPPDWRALRDALGLGAKRHTRFGKLSGGQQQRLSIALALVGNPRIAILDELTTGLDPAARRETWDLIESIRERGVTIVLVTHFMQEAEHLCDRVAVIDAGRIVALDTPAGLVTRVNAEQRLRFYPSPELDDRLLIDLPEVTAVTRRGRQVLVTGTGDVLAAVVSVLARAGVVAEQLRIEQTGLDEAFIALTGQGIS